MILQFKITLKRGQKTVAEVEGFDVRDDLPTVADVTAKIFETEQHIEKLTGLRCHIEQVR